MANEKMRIASVRGQTCRSRYQGEITRKIGVPRSDQVRFLHVDSSDGKFAGRHNGRLLKVDEEDVVEIKYSCPQRCGSARRR